MMPIARWAVCAAVFCPPPAWSALPLAVEEELNELAAFCRQLGGRPHGFEGAVEQADLNGDGITDYVLDDGELQCYGTRGVFGGFHGCGVTVFVGRAGGGAEKSFLHGAFGSRVDRRGRQAVLYLGMAGEACGQDIAGKKRGEYERCSRPLKWNPAGQKFEIDMTVKKPALNWLGGRL
ncbi:MAG: hypothetical protein Q3966_10200 [Neisseria sp.]|nr:hypothetical protein [Neisseria sp.]